MKGNGKRVIYTFEDPNCGYCKELQKELAKLNDVTIYTFLWPILSQDSVDKSKAIWCAHDRGEGLGRLHAQGRSRRSGKRDCDTPLESNGELAQRFGIRGTPGVFWRTGSRSAASSRRTSSKLHSPPRADRPIHGTSRKQTMRGSRALIAAAEVNMRR